MVPPHGTSCLTCSVEPLGYRAGVPLAGVADTAPGTIPADIASDGAASPPTLTAIAPAITPARLNIWIPPMCTEHPQMNTRHASAFDFQQLCHIGELLPSLCEKLTYCSCANTISKGKVNGVHSHGGHVAAIWRYFADLVRDLLITGR